MSQDAEDQNISNVLSSLAEMATREDIMPQNFLSGNLKK